MSFFPTNGAGPDEDVNVYLGNLLTSLVLDPRPETALFGSEPQFHPPGKDRPRGERADWYRRQADQRLVYLGLFDRGEGRRRRAQLQGLTAAQTRRRDMVCGRSCYQAAANLLAGRDPRWSGLAEVMRKLGDHFDQYVHVLGVVGVRRLGLHTVLSENALQGLVPGGIPAAARAKAAVAGSSGTDGRPERAQPGHDMDELLDLWLEHARTRSADDLHRLRAKAAILGIPAGNLKGPPPGQPG